MPAASDESGPLVVVVGSYALAAYAATKDKAVAIAINLAMS